MSGWISVTICKTKGSTPREAGAHMRVWPDRIEGTIGGGALEWEAILHARQMLVTGHTQTRRSFALGPELGQCCGGAVSVDFIADAPVLAPSDGQLWIWGGGHVGRAIAAVMAPFEQRQITLIDISAEKLPDPMPAHVSPLVAADPVRVVTHAPSDAEHIVATHSHDLDLRLCDALLHHGFRSLGLIGSATKAARFRSRLGALNHSNAQISRIACPIGDPSLGKHPQAIALGVASALVRDLSVEHAAPRERVRAG